MNAKLKASKKKVQKEGLDKKKSESISKLKKIADKKFSEYIRQRDNGTCFTCGITRPWKEMQNGHYVSRGVLALRYDEENCHCQCMPCNIYKHGNYTVYALRMVEKYGPDILKKLNDIANSGKNTVQKYGRVFYENIINKYK